MSNIEDSTDVISVTEKINTLWKRFNNLINTKPAGTAFTETLPFQNNVITSEIFNQNIPLNFLLTNDISLNILDDNNNITLTINVSVNDLSYLTIESLDNIFDTNQNIQPGSKCNFENFGYPYLEFFYKKECYPTILNGGNSNKQIYTWFIPDPSNGDIAFPSTKNLLKNTVPNKYDPYNNTYQYKLYYKNTPTTFKKINFASQPEYAYLENKSGFLYFYGGIRNGNDVTLSYIRPQSVIDPTKSPPYISYIKYNGNLGLTDLKLYGKTIIDGSFSIINDLSFSDISNLDYNVINTKQLKQFIGNLNNISGGFFVTRDDFNNTINNLNLSISGDFITREEFDASFANINVSVSGNFITRQDLDASFANINLSVSGNFITRSEFDSSYNYLETKSDNFFFFFKLKPWSLVYIDGSYSYPIGNIGNGNSFLYNLGNFSNSYIDDLSQNSSNLQLFWKIPPRIFLESNLSYNNVNYVPIYNNLIIEYKEKNETYWKKLFNINNFPDPSNNSNYSSYDNDNINFVFNLTRNSSQLNDISSINIVDNSFIINYVAGYNSIQNSKSYQFRCFLENNSDLSNNFDYKEDNYGYDSSNNYLYFPDVSNLFFTTSPRGDPKPPTDIEFINSMYNFVSISGELDSSTADINNLIPLPIAEDDINNQLVFILDLISMKNTNYKKFIGYSLNDYIINDISNSNNPSTNGKFFIDLSNEIHPEFTYILSNYGMFFANDDTNITYSTLVVIFITPPPLRNEVDSSFNNFIDYYNIFNNSLDFYNENIVNKNIKKRGSNDILNMNFFDNSSNIININKNNMYYKLFNSINSNNINTLNEPIGNDFINNNLCEFILKTEKLNNNSLSFNYNNFIIETSFNNFITKTINKENLNYKFNYTSQDILPYNLNSSSDYSKTNGYYVGLILNDICFNIDLNDFFDENNDVSLVDVSLKTSIEQVFNNQTYINDKEYYIYKINNDLKKNITLDLSSTDFSLNYNESNQGTYFGLTSIKPHNIYIYNKFHCLLNNLNKYLHDGDNNILCNINIKITGTNNINNSENIIWPNNNLSYADISHVYNYYPFTFLNNSYGYYEGNYSFNGNSDLIIYNNLFADISIINLNNFSLGNTIDISNKYFWNTERIGTNNNYFNDNNMLVFNNDPLTYTNNSNSGGILYQVNNIGSYIKYNQALFQNNSISLFYSGNNSAIYKDYSNYVGNNDINLDYSIYDNSGDNVNYTINAPFWFQNTSIHKTINNMYKWVCFDIDLSNLVLINDNINLSLNDTSVNNIGNEVLFYIKLKYNGNLIVNGNTINYSKWLDCQSILNTSLSNSQRVLTNKAGVYNNTITPGIYPLKLILPYLSSYTDRLILLIGINNYNLNLNNINLQFNQ